MSRWFRKRAELFVGPRGVHLNAGAEAEHAAPAASAACTHERSYDAALDVLETVLGRSKLRKHDVHVTLSNHFVRYAVVPALAGARRTDGPALARHRFETLFGEDMSGWHIRVDDPSARWPSLGAAVPQVLVAGIEARLRGAGLSVRSIQPLFARSVRAAQRSLRVDPIWLLTVEPGRVCVGCAEAGVWRALRNERLEAPHPAALAALLDQTRLACPRAVQAGTVRLVNWGAAPVPACQSGPWTIEPVGLTH